MIVLLGTISTVNAGAIETVATACAVHVAIPDTTVYEVVTPGTTVIEDVVAPLDHVKGPLPDADKVVFAPKQIVVFVGVTFTEELVITDTVATAAAVQVLAPDNTEQVVVTDGDTDTEAALAGLVPVLAVQINGAEPPEESVTICPEQIVVADGVILIDGVKEIETVATAEDVQVPVPEITV